MIKKTEILELRKEATAWVNKNPNKGIFGPFISRSCWECNPVHEYLKNADYPIQCFDCGKIFFKGIIKKIKMLFDRTTTLTQYVYGLAAVKPISSPPNGQLFYIDFKYITPIKKIRKEKLDKLNNIIRKDKLKYIEEMLKNN